MAHWLIDLLRPVVVPLAQEAAGALLLLAARRLRNGARQRVAPVEVPEPELTLFGLSSTSRPTPEQP